MLKTTEGTSSYLPHGLSQACRLATKLVLTAQDQHNNSQTVPFLQGVGLLMTSGSVNETNSFDGCCLGLELSERTAKAFGLVLPLLFLKLQLLQMLK